LHTDCVSVDETTGIRTRWRACGWHRGVLEGLVSRCLRSVAHPVEMPLAGDAFQFVIPASSNWSPEPAVRSLTVGLARISPAWASAPTRAPMWTARPRMWSPASSISRCGSRRGCRGRARRRLRPAPGRSGRPGRARVRGTHRQERRHCWRHPCRRSARVCGKRVRCPLSELAERYGA
jgi:hypothetical protein